MRSDNEDSVTIATGKYNKQFDVLANMSKMFIKEKAEQVDSFVYTDGINEFDTEEANFAPSECANKENKAFEYSPRTDLRLKPVVKVEEDKRADNYYKPRRADNLM